MHSPFPLFPYTAPSTPETDDDPAYHSNSYLVYARRGNLECLVPTLWVGGNVELCS